MGGLDNDAKNDYGTVGGGEQNEANDKYNTIGGGKNNFTGSNSASRSYITISGGEGNTASYHRATIGGGYDNRADDDSATVGGGYQNYASNDSATVGGGWLNEALDTVSTVPGGYGNKADGDYSFAAGQEATASHDYSFVWGGDSGGSSDGTNTFNVHSNEIYLNGSVYHSSDRNKKEGFQTVNTKDILNKLSEMPMTTWRFKTEDSSTVHIGPMAQDFKQTFGFGATDKHIAATDASGVALAAIQELNRTLISVIMKREEALKKMELRLRIAEQRLAEKESLSIDSR